MSNIIRANPPEAHKNHRGKQPSLLTDDVVKILLSSPNTWFLVASKSNWISGIKKNIESMTQSNIKHLADVGKFEIAQRKNNETGYIDIYCQFVTTSNEEE